ncbi:MAG: TRAP transporter substrate-binding protein [Candidatus Dormibacteraceae bacterium]
MNISRPAIIAGWGSRAVGVSLVALFTVLLAACGGSPSSTTSTNVTGEKITLRLCDVLPASDPSNQGLDAAAAYLSQHGNGLVTLQVFPAGQLGTLTGCFTELKNNTIQMMNQDPTTTTALLPEAGAFAAPFQFPSFAAEQKAWNSQTGQKVAADFVSQAGVHLFAPWEFGIWDLYSATKPITSCSDLNGVKVRIPPSTALLEFFKQCGAVPVLVDISQAALDLQTHAVEAIPLPNEVLVGNNMQKLVHYNTQLGFLHDVLQPIINNVTWDRMSPSERSLLVAALQAGEQVNSGQIAAARSQAVAALQAAGVQTVQNVDIASFQAAADREVVALASQWGGIDQVKALIAAGKA